MRLRGRYMTRPNCGAGQVFEGDGAGNLRRKSTSISFSVCAKVTEDWHKEHVLTGGAIGMEDWFAVVQIAVIKPICELELG